MAQKQAYVNSQTDRGANMPRRKAVDPQPPMWVRELVGVPEMQASANATHFTDAFGLISVCVNDVSDSDGPGIEKAAAEAYEAIGAQLDARSAWHPVRIWNFVPRIIDASDGGMNRYMWFNAGRHRAFSKWFGGTDSFDRLLPTASAVGHGGPGLVVHALVSRQPGKAIENPRQVPPHRYSQRFGPMPPCFARAMRIGANGENLLLVGGTASVLGEESVHVGDLHAQLTETFANLSALVQNAFGVSKSADGLEHYRSLRIYHVDSSDRAAIESRISSHFASLSHVEYLEVDLCRPDLLVEIEGVAAEIR